MREAAEDHPQLAELRDRPVEKQKKKSKQGLKHVADMRVFTNGGGAQISILGSPGFQRQVPQPTGGGLSFGVDIGQGQASHLAPDPALFERT